MQDAKFHLSLDVKNVDESVRFYSALFNTGATKLKPGYAKFDLASPPLNLTLQEAGPQTIAGLNHMGVRVGTLEEVLAVRERLNQSGIATMDEMNTTCCYAVQDKIWVADPTGYRWEVYIFKGDSGVAFDRSAQAEQACDCGPVASAVQDAPSTVAASCCTPKTLPTGETVPCC